MGTVCFYVVVYTVAPESIWALKPYKNVLNVIAFGSSTPGDIYFKESKYA